MKTQMKQATIYCVGIKNRCRKFDRHTLNLPERAAEQFDADQALKDAVEIVRRTMKTVTNARLTIHEFTLENDGHGLIRSFSIALGQDKSVDILPLIQNALLSA